MITRLTITQLYRNVQKPVIQERLLFTQSIAPIHLSDSFPKERVRSHPRSRPSPPKSAYTNRPCCVTLGRRKPSPWLSRSPTEPPAQRAPRFGPHAIRAGVLARLHPRLRCGRDPARRHPALPCAEPGSDGGGAQDPTCNMSGCWRANSAASYLRFGLRPLFAPVSGSEESFGQVHHSCSFAHVFTILAMAVASSVNSFTPSLD